MKMPVPGNWTLHGTFDRPHYTNVQMPFPEEPPRVPEKNPTGCYRTTFEIPQVLEWAAHRGCISAARRACFTSTSTASRSA